MKDDVVVKAHGNVAQKIGDGNGSLVWQQFGFDDAQRGLESDHRVGEVGGFYWHGTSVVADGYRIPPAALS